MWRGCVDLAFALAAPVPEEAEDGQGDRGNPAKARHAGTDAADDARNGGVGALDVVNVLAHLTLLVGGFQLQKGALMLQIAHRADSTQITHGAPPLLLQAAG